MFIVRPTGKHDQHTLTVAALNALRITYPAIHRRTGRTVGGLFTEVEPAGVDKAHVHVHATSTAVDDGEVQRAVGGKPYARHHRVPVMDAARHMRRMTDADADALAAHDATIEAARRALADARAMRSAFVRQAWRRAQPLYPSDLARHADSAQAR